MKYSSFRDKIVSSVDTEKTVLTRTIRNWERRGKNSRTCLSYHIMLSYFALTFWHQRQDQTSELMDTSSVGKTRLQRSDHFFSRPNPLEGSRCCGTRRYD